MALVSNKTLSRPPYNTPCTDPRTGLMTNSWVDYNEQLWRKIGPNTSSLSDLESVDTSNSNDISSLKQNINTVSENVSKVDQRTTTNEEDISDLKSQQNIDHESIVTAGQEITKLKQSDTTQSQEISDIKNDVEDNTNKINSIQEKLYKIRQVSALPNSSQYASEIVRLTGQTSGNGLYFSDDGINWTIIFSL